MNRQVDVEAKAVQVKIVRDRRRMRPSFPIETSICSAPPSITLGNHHRMRQRAAPTAGICGCTAPLSHGTNVRSRNTTRVLFGDQTTVGAS